MNISHVYRWGLLTRNIFAFSGSFIEKHQLVPFLSRISGIKVGNAFRKANYFKLMM